MTVEISIRRAGPEDSTIVGGLVYSLIGEIVPGYTGIKPERSYSDAAAALLADHTGVWAFIASAGTGRHVGVITLNECAAVYAGGLFGEISELYVASDFRSAGVGAMLIDTAIEFGKKRRWSVLEVGAPDVPRWQKTVDFYLSRGFEVVGPRLDYDLQQACTAQVV